MDKRFEKDLERMYMVLDADRIQEGEYQFQMAVRGMIPSVLPPAIVTRDGVEKLRIDVTGCTSIASRFGSMLLRGGDLRRILGAVRDTAARLPRFLMDPGDLWLDPDCIFLGQSDDEVQLCYIPHLSEEEPHTVRALAEFFLKKLDHADPAAVQMAYTFYDMVSGDSYVLEDVITRLMQESSAAAAAQAPAHPTGQQTMQDTGLSGGGRPGWAQTMQDAGLSGGARPGWAQTMQGAGLSGGGHAGWTAGSPEGQSAGMNADLPGSVGGIRKLPPPAGKRRGRKAKRPRAHRSAIPGPHRKRKAAKGWRRWLPLALIPAAAVLLIFLFRMDLTQAGGMGFLSAALIWMTKNAIDRKHSELNNVWADEDDPGDDEFYQSLLKEVYAQDPTARQPAYGVQAAAAQQPGYGAQAAAQQPGYGVQAAAAQRPGYGAQQPGYGVQAAAAQQPGYGAQAAAMQQEGYGPQAGYSPCLISLQKDRCPDIPVVSGHMLLGKSRTKADVLLPDDTVSRIHARIEQRTDGCYVTDMYSTNGTFLDGERIESGRAFRLRDGALLSFASLRYQVNIPQTSSAHAAQKVVS